MSFVYVTFNKGARRWQYQLACPPELRTILTASKPFGKTGQPFQRHWLSEAPRVDTPAAERVAMDLARPFYERDSSVLARAKTMTADERQYAVEHGGLALMQQTLSVVPTLLDRFAAFPIDDPEGDAAKIGKPPGDIALLYSQLAKAERGVREMVAEHQAIVLKAEAPSEFSFDGLLAVYVKRQGPQWRGRTDNHERTVKELRRHLGDIDYRSVAQTEAVAFRDALETCTDKNGEPQSRDWQVKHLQRASAMYAAAISEGTYTKGLNPFVGVHARGRDSDHDGDDLDLLSPAQLRRILETAERADEHGRRWGGKRHAEALWLLKVMTWSGMRPNEVLQLQRGDIYAEPESGVTAMHIRRVCAVTGKRLRTKVTVKGKPVEVYLKSMKNPKLRDVYVPLHPAIADFATFATNAKPAEFVFDAFELGNPSKKRRGWFDQNFAGLLRDAGVEPKPGKKLSLYSIRLSFHRACDNSGMPKRLKDAATSHAAQDICDKYSRGADLRLLADAVAKVQPLADVTVDISPK